MGKETVMPASGVTQFHELLHLDDDDFDEPGALGLHLGVLRSFALFALGEQLAAAPTRPATGR